MSLPENQWLNIPVYLPQEEVPLSGGRRLHLEALPTVWVSCLGTICKSAFEEVEALFTQFTQRHQLGSLVSGPMLVTFKTFRVMQQKAFEESRYPWQESFENVAVCLPFRCPRCGDHTRFRSLSSLRAHLEFSHSYEARTLLTKCSLFPSLKDTDLVTSSELLRPGKLQSSGNVVKQKPSYVNLYSISHEHSKDRKPFEVVAERPVSYVQTYTALDLRADSMDRPRSGPGLPASDTKASFEAHVREKFNQMVEAVDRTIEKRIDKLTKELAQKTAELLEVRAAFVQLTQKKQEVQRRERALNRQVDVAVEMIAALRQRLTESEEELLRKEE
ncbi:Protein ZNF365 [Plecturocebus cupreus]